MTDYGEEQRNELEAIESIYPDSFTVLSEEPTSFTITVTSDAGENEETVEVTLKFTYVEKYPDEPPLWEIFSQENLEDSDTEDILNFLSWKARFEQEMVELKKKRQKEEEQPGKGKLTGEVKTY
uniref:RWD domain containing 1 n=1 Tax=Cyprinus carpio TaxID=7962 RepID=A0A8C2DJQ3_CYPCA